MNIGIDAMGGDYAPLEAVKGSILYKKSNPSVDITLFGKKSSIEECFETLGEDSSQFNIINADEVIEMSEHATKAITSKKNSSINIGLKHLANKQIDAFIGAGNTGAMLVGSLFIIKPIDGIQRPTITSVLPKSNGKTGVLLDVGANADAKPEMILQWAILGSLYSQFVNKIENPRVGLLNIGEEKEKGNILAQSTHQYLETNNNKINFLGNIEARDIFEDNADVVVCDGFTGNVIIKVCEGMYYNLAKRGINDEFLDRFNFKHYGGTPVLGINECVLIGHGITKAPTFEKMFELAVEIVNTKLIEKIKSSFQ